jgi:hypothetical protein
MGSILLCCLSAVGLLVAHLACSVVCFALVDQLRSCAFLHGSGFSFLVHGPLLALWLGLAPSL